MLLLAYMMGMIGISSLLRSSDRFIVSQFTLLNIFIRSTQTDDDGDGDEPK